MLAKVVAPVNPCPLALETRRGRRSLNCVTQRCIAAATGSRSAKIAEPAMRRSAPASTTPAAAVSLTPRSTVTMASPSSASGRSHIERGRLAASGPSACPDQSAWLATLDPDLREETSGPLPGHRLGGQSSIVDLGSPGRSQTAARGVLDRILDPYDELRRPVGQ